MSSEPEQVATDSSFASNEKAYIVGAAIDDQSTNKFYRVVEEDDNTASVFYESELPSFLMGEHVKKIIANLWADREYGKLYSTLLNGLIEEEQFEEEVKKFVREEQALSPVLIDKSILTLHYALEGEDLSEETISDVLCVPYDDVKASYARLSKPAKKLIGSSSEEISNRHD